MMPTTQSLEERYRLTMERVAAAAARAGRRADEVFVVAVTKYAELDDILELIALGHRDFGESRVPQMVDRAHAINDLLADGDAFEARLRAIRRARALAGDGGSSSGGLAGGVAGGGAGGAAGSGAGGIVGVPGDGPDDAPGATASADGAPGGRVIGGIIGGIDIGERSGIGRTEPRIERIEPGPVRAPAHDRPVPRWHMIGHLQRNKVKKCMEVVRLVHSVDSLRLIEEIHNWAFKKDREVDVLLQVNCSGEAQKDGCAPAAAVHLAETIDSMVHLRLRGLMTMAPLSDDPEDARPAFQLCREIFEDIRREGIGEDRFNLLSMGMSGDFEIGIECGSNVVRIGSAIFGEREMDDADEEPDED